MTAGALGEERPTLFLRKATGLVRGWSVRDSLIYACLATNFVTLGISSSPSPALVPEGPAASRRCSSRAIWVSFLVIAYTGLVVTIPRAGGDYVWQTRILGSGIGFVMAATGWWFILWLWAPIYGNILRGPAVPAAVGDAQGPGPAAARLVRHAQRDLRRHPDHDRAGRPPGLDRHGRLRQGPEAGASIGGLIGFAVIVILLLINSHADFIASFNREAQQALRRQPRLRGHQRGGRQGRLHAHRRSASARSGRRMLLVPTMMFFLLWPNWGTTLYGEIRGASDFKRVFTGMFFGLWTHGRLSRSSSCC